MLPPSRVVQEFVEDDDRPGPDPGAEAEEDIAGTTIQVTVNMEQTEIVRGRFREVRRYRFSEHSRDDRRCWRQPGLRRSRLD